MLANSDGLLRACAWKAGERPSRVEIFCLGSRAWDLETSIKVGGTGFDRDPEGGEALEGDGFYVEPTLVETEDPSNLLVQEEVFAPVAVLMRASSARSAAELANAVRYGLVAAVFTRDLERAMTTADRLETGLVRVNGPTSGVDFHVPFGGSKGSSIGPRQQGLAARDFYTETRTVLISPPPAP